MHMPVYVIVGLLGLSTSWAHMPAHQTVIVVWL